MMGWNKIPWDQSGLKHWKNNSSDSVERFYMYTGQMMFQSSQVPNPDRIFVEFQGLQELDVFVDKTLPS